MTPEQLAPILYTREVEHSGIKAAPWEGLHESHRRKWYVLAEAALTALRGPRTGEELYEAFGAAAKEELGCEYQRPSWTELAEWWRAVHHQVVATFATPKPPEGWPKGWSTKGVMRTGPGGTIALKMGQPNIWYLDVTPDGATSIKEVWRIAGLVAHTLANGAPVQPTSTVDHGAEIERLKTALRAEVNAHIETKNVLAIVRRDEQRAQERLSAMRDVAEEFAERLANLHRDNLQAMIERAIRPAAEWCDRCSPWTCDCDGGPNSHREPDDGR